MTVSTIGVADASSPDKYLHTNQRTISSTAREDQYVLQGEGAYPTYVARAGGVSVATANDHLLQIMGDGSNYSRIKSISVYPAAATSAGSIRVILLRLSTAGTGGSSVTLAPFDTADTYGGGAMALPSSKGTEGVTLLSWSMHIPTSSSAGMTPYIWTPRPGMKPIIFGTATSNGIALKVITAATGGTVDAMVEFTTTSYL